MDVTRADVDAIADLAARRGHDLRAYLPGFLEPAISVRARATRCATARDYTEHVSRRPEELAELLGAVVVTYTALFRDPEVFEALERVVVPAVAADLDRRDHLRGWVAGAATGEEAWSLAAVFARACPAFPGFRVVGSDVSAACLPAARAGRYRASSLPARWLRDPAKLLWEDAGAVVAGERLRDQVTFAEHDLLGPSVAPREAVVASFHVVMLRNVLIYLHGPARRRVLERLASTVEPGGALVLGLVETPPDRLSRLLQPFPGVDPRLKVYRVGVRR